MCDRRSAVSLAFVLALCTASAYAVAPTIGEILPRGAERATTPEIDIVGGNLADAVDLMFDELGITLAEMKPVDNGKVHCKLQITPDCRLGTHAVRVRTKTGVTNMRLFSVGGLKEVNEVEPNNDIATAQVIEMGSTVNGETQNEDVDYYAVNLQQGQKLAAEIEAIRLGGPLFDPKLRLFDPGGHEIIAEDDTAMMVQDAAFVYHATAAGKYVIAVSEAAFGGGGGDYYRLHVGQFPRPLAVTPMGGVPSAQEKVKWLGDPDLPEQTIAVPATPIGINEVDPVTDAGVTPTPIPFRVSDLPDALDVEPDNEIAKAVSGTAPGAFDGVIDAPGDVDFFGFDGKKGQVYDVRAYAREMGSPLDSVMTMFNPSGSTLADNDDAIGVDSQFRVTLAEDGKQVIRITDHLGAGGPAFAYRIEVTPVKPILKLGFLENDYACTTIPQANRSFFLLSAARADFDGPLGVTFDALPPGVTADCDPIPAGQGAIPVVLSAKPDSPLAGAMLGINAKLNQDGSDVHGGIDYNLKLIEGANKITFFGRQIYKLAAAVSDPAPFTLELAVPKAPIVLNGSMNLKVTVTRAAGFTAPINLRIPWVPPGVGAGTADIPENGTEANVTINANTGAAVGKWRLAIVGSSSGWTVCTSLTPIEIAQPWVTFDVTKAETEQGKPTKLVVNVAKTKDFDGSYKAELLGLPKGVTSTPQDMTKDTTQLTFPIDVAADAPAGKFGGLFVRAVFKFEGEDVLHQWGSGNLAVFQPLPAALAPPPPPPAEQAKPDAPKKKTRFPTST